MTLFISILKECQTGEKRVAMTPVVAASLEKLGATVRVETGAGLAAYFPDQAYGAERIEADRTQLLAVADMVLAVQPPSIDAIKLMKPGAVLISFVYETVNPQLVEALKKANVSAFAMERIPRISRAQSMDALTSQAALAGYYAPLLGAVQMPRILPMMTTAVGSLRAARVLVMGLGVAGLQALATAHRLGAVTQGYDVRPETAEQACSLGAKFIDTGVDARGEGGYARELSNQEKETVKAVLTKHVSQADMIITTASVPGRKAPRLISKVQIEAMKPGAVIVDLSAENGGNCEGTIANETVTIGQVKLLGPVNVPSMLAEHASELYAKNLLNLIQLMVKDGVIQLDLDDEIITKTALTLSPATATKPSTETVEKQEAVA